MRIALHLLAVLQLALAGGPARAQAGPTFSQADVDAIREATQVYARAAREGAWPIMARFFTDDGVLLPPNTTATQGRAAIETWLRSLPPTRDLRIEPIEIGGRGDLAYSWGRYSIVVAVPGIAAIPDSGKYLEIWRKQQDGSWKLSRSAYSSDLPLPVAVQPVGQRR
ncbi:MAG: DUF4440 domain-containing protein [Gemmatimonadetes bacterium]|nr:DUF4440 domain-containing protein [Gemmatimonadota bacterium]